MKFLRSRFFRRNFLSAFLLLLFGFLYIILILFFRSSTSSSSSSFQSSPRKLGTGNKEKMPLKMVDATLSTFDQVWDMFRSEAPNHKFNLVLFLADKDPSTNLSWCPDCVRAEPVTYKKLEAHSEEVALLRAFVGDRPTWRTPAHPWRSDPKFKLRGVPTLIRWDNDKEAVTARLEDHEAHLEHKIDALLAAP